WMVVDAVNATPQLRWRFPVGHAAQQAMADEWRELSRAGFNNWVGAIAGLLIWTQKPTTKDCDTNDMGPKPFFCGRKKKVGLNMQAVCDANCKFLDVSITGPASSSCLGPPVRMPRSLS
ncbi:MAG: hypothetical protein ACRDL7_03755, partial [Gaiellaceae bacterium]